ncbi:hypothetical protein [Microcystis phage Mwe-JY08]
MIIIDEPALPEPRLPIGQAPPAPEPTFGQTMGAAFRQVNTVGSTLAALGSAAGTHFEPEDGFKVSASPRWKDSVYEREYADRFVAVQSQAEFDALANKIDAERKDQEILSASGWGGVVASIGMGIVDPTILLPGGALVRSVRGGFSAGRSAVTVGAAGFAQGVAVESILSAGQQTRTAGDFALGVAASTILSGLFGAGAARLLSGAERRALEAAFDVDFNGGRAAAAAAADTVTPVPGAAAGAAVTPGEAVPGLPGEAANVNIPGGPAMAASAGAAAADTRVARPMNYFLQSIPGVGRAVEAMSPVLRTMQSGLTSARRVAVDLAETALRTVDNAEGVATTRGPSAEREIKLAQRQTMIAMSDVMEDAFKRYRFGSSDAAPVFAKARVALGENIGLQGRTMTFAEFKEEVGRAMRRGDTSPIPEVAEVAGWVRQNVFNPWWSRFKALPENAGREMGDVKTAESFFSRVYNQDAIKAKMPEFVNRLTDWLESEQARKAAVQREIEDLDARRRALKASTAKVEAKLERAAARLDELAAREAERSMEVGRTEGRVDALADRIAAQEAELTELADAIDELKAEASSPEVLGRIDDLQRELSVLRREEKAARMTEAQMRAADEAELRGRFLATDEQKFVADVVIGRRKPEVAPSFVSYIVENGGIRDTGGELRGMTGGKHRPGLLNSQGRDFDEWGEKLFEDFGWYFQERPTAREVEEFLDEALRKREPGWFVEGRASPEAQTRIELSEQAREIEAEMSRLGYEGKSRLEVARFLRDHSDPIPAGPERFDEMGVPPSIETEAGENSLLEARQVVLDIRDAIATARTRAKRVVRAANTNDVRLGEAGMAARANVSRLDTLEGQRAAVEARRRIAEAARDLMRAEADDVMGQIEAKLQGWGGKSAADAVSAIRSREKAAAGRAPDAPRLEAADGDVLTAVRRILGSDRDLSRMELEARGREIADRITSSPDGRLPYDDPSTGGASGGGGGGRADPRGSLARRELMIPDDAIEDFLESDVEFAARRFMHSAAPDVVLAERFGDSAMTAQLKAIQEEAQQLAARNPERSAEIMAEKDAAIRDIAGMRDRIRGTYILQGSRNAARVGSAIRSFNMLTDLGGSTLSSVADAAGVVFRWGLGTVLSDAYRPWIKGLAGQSEGYKLAKQQYRAMGIGVEMALATRLSAMDEISPLYRPTSRAERALASGAEKFQILNLQAPWTDFTKTVASIVTGNEVLRAARAVAEGAATQKQITSLAENGIDAQLARRIWNEWSRPGAGEVVDGVHLPNTDRWNDRAARLAFEGAVSREADIAVITPGQEKPLWMSTPILGLIGQHKSFVFAATERIMLANLQRADAQALVGLLTAISAGMISATLYALATGKDLPERPQDWVKEGISRSGVLGWFDEVNSITAKATRGGVDAYRLIGADKPLSRFSSQTILAQALGPTAGKVETIAKVTGAPFGEEGWDARDTANVRRLIPLQNLWAIRRLLNEVEDAGNAAFGIDPLER